MSRLPTVDRCDDEDENTAKGFLSNTMGLMVSSKAGEGDEKKKKNSKIANDLDALFGKLVWFSLIDSYLTLINWTFMNCLTKIKESSEPIVDGLAYKTFDD